MTKSAIQSSINGPGPDIENLSISTVTESQTLTVLDCGTILCSSISSDYEIILPSSNSMANRFGYLFKKTDESPYKITINCNLSETIDGFEKQDLINQGEVLHIISDGSNWKIQERNYNSKWETIPPFYSYLDTSTLSTTVDLRPLIKRNRPIKYMIEGHCYHGICSSIDAESIGIKGAPLISGKAVSQLSVGPESMVHELTINIPGNFANSVSDLVDSKLNMKIPWTLPTAYLVSFGGYEKTAASTTQPKINMKIGDNLISSNDNNNGIQMSTSWTYNPATAINTDHYEIFPSPSSLSPTLIEIACTSISVGATAASDLMLNALFVFSDKYKTTSTTTLDSQTDFYSGIDIGNGSFALVSETNNKPSYYNATIDKYLWYSYELECWVVSAEKNNNGVFIAAQFSTDDLPPLSGYQTSFENNFSGCSTYTDGEGNEQPSDYYESSIQLYGPAFEQDYYGYRIPDSNSQGFYPLSYSGGEWHFTDTLLMINFYGNGGSYQYLSGEETWNGISYTMPSKTLNSPQIDACSGIDIGNGSFIYTSDTNGKPSYYNTTINKYLWYSYGLQCWVVSEEKNADTGVFIAAQFSTDDLPPLSGYQTSFENNFSGCGTYTDGEDNQQQVDYYAGPIQLYGDAFEQGYYGYKILDSNSQGFYLLSYGGGEWNFTDTLLHVYFWGSGGSESYLTGGETWSGVVS